MKKHIIRLSILFFALILSSCEKWLDVEPKSQIKASELLQNEAGFKEALAGIYTILTDQSLYGKELTYGMMGVLSHEWIGYPAAYQPDFEYDYTGASTQARIAAIWSKMYQAITNTNYILENIDERKNVFSGDNYAIIKGEALALRAFIHFDLLRTFSVNYSINPSQNAIPYVTMYSATPTVQYTVDEVIRKIIVDLKSARTLLTVDPIYTGKTISENDDNGYLINRQLHLNYFAVEGLLARAYLYMEDFEQAEIFAQNVINSDKFSFSTQANIIAGTDLSGAPEHLFGLQVVNLSEYVQNFLTEEGTSIFSMDLAGTTSVYENSTIDYRYQYLFKPGNISINANRRYLTKYSTVSSATSYYKNKIPVIKLSEIYYILAECAYQNGADVLPHLNKVRQARGLPDFTTSPPDFRLTMTNEFTKEFFAEGQLFYYYKRLNVAFTPRALENIVDIKGYIFPIPDAEYDAATRGNNR